MTFVFSVNSPEAMRDAIVKWLKWNASNHRIKGSNAKLVATRNEEHTMARAYQEAAEFIEAAHIETKS